MVHDSDARLHLESDYQWTISVELTEAEFKRALNRFWFRAYRIQTWAKPILLTAALACSFATSEVLWIALLWAALGLSILQYSAAYLRYRRRNLRAFRERETRADTYRFSNDGVAITTELSSTQLKWRAFNHLWRYSDVWLLVIRKAQFHILPTRDLPDELWTFIRRRIALCCKGPPKCDKCGYDLRGQLLARCPECGTEFDEDLLRIRH